MASPVKQRAFCWINARLGASGRKKKALSLEGTSKRAAEVMNHGF